MIVEVPTPEEFHTTGLNQLHLAWQIAVQAMQDVEHYDQWAHEEGQLDKKQASNNAETYWAKLQPNLANALGLIQQSMEMALKGRIAVVSPFLLISRDPKDWPKGVDKVEKPFSDFRTLSAADLVKVHNTFCSPPLDQKFQDFWNNVRRDRNKIMHSVSRKSFHPKTLVKSIFFVAKILFPETPWPQTLLRLSADNAYSAQWLIIFTHSPVMRQIQSALGCLEKADKKEFLGFEHRKSYFCPVCLPKMEPDCFEDGAMPPKLAQLKSRNSQETTLGCIVCGENTSVERKKCYETTCKTNVISGGRCMSCGRRQDNPERFASGLEIDESDPENLFTFDFRDKLGNVLSSVSLESQENAIKHAHIAMSQSYLYKWDRVVVTYYSQANKRRTVVGNWQRKSTDLVWDAGKDPDFSEEYLQKNGL